ncbi:MAG TPA: zinc-binding dehydrogenase [Gemmataceae bacterium]|nr:zinc-binding dehydrogenase [Gemmataceae bacterium]
MTSSLAAVFEGIAGQIELRRLPTPKPRGSEILVRVLACTLCGSDVHTFAGRRSVAVPTVLGHEIVGEIVEFGETANTSDLSGREIRPGDRVTWAIVASCGACFLCRRGLPQKCLHAVKYGHEPLRPGRELLGGLASHCLLVPGTSILRLPDDLPLAVACPSSCATATIVAALEAAGDLQDRNICIFGAGMLGITACAMARGQGAAEIVCVDPISTRRDRALLFGASRVAAPDDLAVVVDSTVSTLGFDAVLELSGNPAAFHAAWPRIRLGGTLVLVGSVFPGAPIPLPLEEIVRRHLTIRGIHNYSPRHLLAAVDFLSCHHRRIPFAGLVTHWFPLTSIAPAFAECGQRDAIRIGVYPGDVPPE